MTECSDVVMVQSGSLCGSGDQFTLEHRMRSMPAQSILVVNSDGIVAHYPVKLGIIPCLSDDWEKHPSGEDDVL